MCRSDISSVGPNEPCMASRCSMWCAHGFKRANEGLVIGLTPWSSPRGITAWVPYSPGKHTLTWQACCLLRSCKGSPKHIQIKPCKNYVDLRVTAVISTPHTVQSNHQSPNKLLLLATNVKVNTTLLPFQALSYAKVGYLPVENWPTWIKCGLPMLNITHEYVVCGMCASCGKMRFAVSKLTCLLASVSRIRLSAIDVDFESVHRGDTYFDPTVLECQSSFRR